HGKPRSAQRLEEREQAHEQIARRLLIVSRLHFHPPRPSPSSGTFPERILAPPSCRRRSTSSRYLSTQPTVSSMTDGSISEIPSPCSARAQSSVSATPGRL